MASEAYKDNGAIIIWWDESEGGDTTNYTIPEIVISPLLFIVMLAEPVVIVIDLLAVIVKFWLTVRESLLPTLTVRPPMSLPALRSRLSPVRPPVRPGPPNPASR